MVGSDRENKKQNWNIWNQNTDSGIYKDRFNEKLYHKSQSEKCTEKKSAINELVRSFSQNVGR